MTPTPKPVEGRCGGKRILSFISLDNPFAPATHRACSGCQDCAPAATEVRLRPRLARVMMDFGSDGPLAGFQFEGGLTEVYLQSEVDATVANYSATIKRMEERVARLEEALQLVRSDDAMSACLTVDVAKAVRAALTPPSQPTNTDTTYE